MLDNDEIMCQETPAAGCQPSTQTGPLLNDEALRAYVSEVWQRITASMARRRSFLVAAHEELAALQAVARDIGLTEIEAEITGWIDQSNKEILRIIAFTPGHGPTAVLQPGLEPERIEEASATCQAMETPPANLADGSESSEGEPAAQEYVPVQPERGAPLLRVPNFKPEQTWKTRPVDEIYISLSGIQAQVCQGEWVGDAGLLQLKSLACQERRAYRELEIQGVEKQLASAVYGLFRDVVEQHHPNAYVMPLDTTLTPADPEAWAALSVAYENLATAQIAWNWFLANDSQLRQSEVAALLNAISATQRYIRNLVVQIFESGSDPQQEQLFQSLRSYAADAGVFIKMLSTSVDEKALGDAASSLGQLFQSLRDGSEKKDKQSLSLQQLMALIEKEGFGLANDDKQQLNNAVAACIKAGIPASNKEMRDSLLPWQSLLGDPRLKRVVIEIQKENDRREKAGAPIDEGGDDDGGISPDIQRKLDELLPYTMDRTMLFMGGKPIEAKRVEAMRMLQLTNLEWPDKYGIKGAGHFEPEIARCDITALLIRFMPHGDADRICAAYGKRLVRLPSGLGINRIVHDLHAQLVPRT